jgi:malonyl-CoA/methylmalonyl-CoA synthetase
MNFYELIRERSSAAGTFILSEEMDPLFDYDDLDRFSARYANHLKTLGVARGDRVMVQVEKSPQCLFLYLACLRLGAVYLPLNTAYLDEELRYFAADATPALIVCDPAREEFFNTLATAQVRTLDATGSGSLTGDLSTDEQFIAEDMADNDTAVILYTSGTTGRPKGAMISHGNLAVNALALLEAWQWQPGDVMLHALPIFHIHGLFVATHLPLLNGSPIIFLQGFNPDLVVKRLPDATVYMGVPTNYTRLIASGQLNRDVCRNIRLFTSGSAPLLESTFREFTAITGHEIVERYGMTETGMNTSNPLDGSRKPGTVGPALPGVAVSVIDANGTAAGIDEPGDLLVKGRNVFTGYWQLPEKTREEFTEDGFFKTGDVASIDADGYVSIVGRNKDMIISGGLNIYPKEIESIIDRLPGISESAVIGLPHDDFGEGVCAVVVPESIPVNGTGISESGLIDDLKTRLANFKVPKWVYFVDSLPRNTMGKVQKNVLREKFKS